MLWVDILTISDALKYPPIDIFGPEILPFEIRIVCWRSRNIYYKGRKFLNLQTSFYLSGEENKSKSTDTHWRCKKGKASWNWRIKIPIELPIDSREKGRLNIMLWNRGIIRSSKAIGKDSIDLYDWLMLCYHRQTQAVFPFKELKEVNIYYTYIHLYISKIKSLF